jgi:hypothetical protein
MRKIILLISFLLTTGFSVWAQPKGRQKIWRITVIGNQFRAKAILQNVTDSSVILLFRKNRTDEINFTMLRKIKLRTRHNKGWKMLTSFGVGGITGGVIIGSQLSRGRTGEPAALAGVVGGIGGGLLVGLTSALAAPLISNIFTTKKFYVQQDSFYYQSLKIRLKPYCLIQ